MKEQMTQFKHKDFYESAIVLSAGIPMIGIERESGNKFVTFVFNDKDFQAENIIEQHWSGELRLPTKDLIRSIHELKNRLYAKASY